MTARIAAWLTAFRDWCDPDRYVCDWANTTGGDDE